MTPLTDLTLPELERYAPQRSDVTFPGFGGDPIKGWYVRPAGVAESLPCVASYIGYGGGRGLPHEWLFYAVAGYANLVMDTRGQGGAWSRGDTPDRSPQPVDPQFPGFMTRGIRSPETYSLRRSEADVRVAVRWLQRTCSGHPRKKATSTGVPRC